MMIGSEEIKKPRNRKVLIFENSFTLTDYLLKKWKETAETSVRRSNRFTAALSGGKSPMEFYCRLSTLKDFGLWQKTRIFLGDERFVPFDHDSSNLKMIKENLLDYVNIPAQNVHPVMTGLRTVELAAEHYKNQLEQFFEFNANNAPRFDFVLLGMGEDGHTASLFPEDRRINEPGRVVLPVSLPKLKEDRVSLSLPVINNARNVVVLVLGQRKSNIIKEVIEGKQDYPVSQVDPVDGQLFYLLDREAAGKLPYQNSYSHEDQAISFLG
jgi:6-phosphogluconolactonase